VAFNLPVIIKLVKQLGVLLIGSAPLIEGIKGFIPKDDKHKDSERLNDLEEAMSMQSNLNEQYENQMKVVQSTLEKVEKSLKFLTYASIGAIVLAFAAIIIALLK
jgi:hypothetical protein